MTKLDLQKELLEKVKEGVKPSDLKKKKKLPDNLPDKNPDDQRLSDFNKSDEGYESDSSDKSIPTPPPLPNQQAKELQAQISSLKKQLQTYKDFKEADMNIKEKYKETISKLQEENKQLNKTIEELKSKGENKEEVKEPIKEKEPKYYLFTCDICEQNKRSKLHLGKVNGLGIDPNKNNKICDWCINKVDLIKNTEQEYKFE